MPYISPEEVKAIRENLKKEFGKSIKFSVRRSHSSTIDIVLVAGNVDFKTTYEQVNQFYVEEHWKHLPQASEVLSKIVKIVNGVKRYEDRNAGDITADYGDSNYFLHLSVGDWNRPYQVKA
jgi:hypothetical protein